MKYLVGMYFSGDENETIIEINSEDDRTIWLDLAEELDMNARTYEEARTRVLRGEDPICYIYNVTKQKLVYLHDYAVN